MPIPEVFRNPNICVDVSQVNNTPTDMDRLFCIDRSLLVNIEMFNTPKDCQLTDK